MALVIERFDPHGGGAERSLAQIASELVRRGHDITVIAGSVFERAEMPDVSYQCLYQSRKNLGILSLPMYRWIRRQIGKGRFDTSLSVTTAVPARVLQPRGGTVRETLQRNIALRRTWSRRMFKRLAIAASLKHQSLLRMERRTLADPMVQRIVAVSRYVQQQLSRHYGIAAGRVDVIPNAAEMPVVAAEEARAWREQVRQGLRISHRATVYLFAAHNTRLKGSETLLRAIRLLAETSPESVVIFAGGMRYADQRLAVKLGVRDRVRFVGPTNDMPRLYAASDVTVLPTFYDPSSKVVIESLMMGVPAITSVFNGAADLVVGPDHNPRGRVLEDPGSERSLAEAMLAMEKESERRACATATADMADLLGMKAHVDQLEAVLERTTQTPTA